MSHIVDIRDNVEWKLSRITMTFQRPATKVGSVEKQVFGDNLSITLKSGFKFTFRYADGVVEIESQKDPLQDNNVHTKKLEHEHLGTPLPAKPRSYIYFLNLSESFAFIQVEADKNIYYEVPIPDVEYSEQKTKEFYDTEKWWRQCVSRSYPEGYKKQGRPTHWDSNVRYRSKYNFLVTDRHGSQTWVDKEAFETCFPECHKMKKYPTSSSMAIFFSNEIVRQLSLYLRGDDNIVKFYGIEFLGDLILLSEKYQSPYLKHWCIGEILSTKWSDITLTKAAVVYERLSETNCEEMKPLKPLLFSLIQQKMVSLDQAAVM